MPPFFFFPFFFSQAAQHLVQDRVRGKKETQGKAQPLSTACWALTHRRLRPPNPSPVSTFGGEGGRKTERGSKQRHLLSCTRLSPGVLSAVTLALELPDEDVDSSLTAFASLRFSLPPSLPPLVTVLLLSALSGATAQGGSEEGQKEQERAGYFVF